MELYYILSFFVIGTVLGSFFNVVGYRLPKEQSIVFPPSHCPNCNHQLTASELVPILSYIFLKGKCRNCHIKIHWFYPLFEFITGILFALSYIKFGLTIDLLIALIFVSTLDIIFISDYQTMIIPDEVLIFAAVGILLITYITSGLDSSLAMLLDGTIAFLFMWMLKLFGDFIFKKESMGGGDIKLLFIFGLYLGWEMAIVSIFLGSFIGLPVSIALLKSDRKSVIPFGPFLSIAAVILFLTQVDFEFIINLLI